MTATDTKASLLEAIRRFPDDDVPRLMLADHLNERDAERVTCPKCKGKKSIYTGMDGMKWVPCYECQRAGTISDTVSRDRDRDLAMYIWLSIELESLGPETEPHAVRGGVEWYNRIRALKIRTQQLEDRHHAAWLACPCPLCSIKVHNPNCSICGGTGDLMQLPAPEIPIVYRLHTFRRGFVHSVSLPMTGAGGAFTQVRFSELRREGPLWHPTPFAKAIVRAFPGLQRLRMLGVEPWASNQHSGWWRWDTEQLPQMLYDRLEGEYPESVHGKSLQPYWRTIEAAHDTLARVAFEVVAADSAAGD